MVALLLALGVRTFVFQAFFVPSASMVPTLEVGDRILVDKLFFSANKLHTGDIIVFRADHAADVACQTTETVFVKRVIATAGERISSVGQTVYINNKPLAEPWLPKGETLGPPIKAEKVPKGELFVMGDNRPESCDSRYWGDVPTSAVIGKVDLIWWRHGHPYLHFL